MNPLFNTEILDLDNVVPFEGESPEEFVELDSVDLEGPNPFPPPKNDFIYSLDWLKHQPGHILLDHSKKMPNLSNMKCGLVKLDLVMGERGWKIASFEEALELPCLPNKAQIQAVIRLINGVVDEDEFLVTFDGLEKMAFHPATVRRMIQVVNTKTFIETVVHATTWLDEKAVKLDSNFVDWLKETLLRPKAMFSSSTYLKTFSPSFLPDSYVDMPTLLSICGSNCLSEASINSVMEFFNSAYGTAVQGLFMPAFYLEHDNLINDKYLQKQGTCAKKIYTAVHYDQHWGSMIFDLENDKVLISESADREIPVDGIKHWLECISSALGKGGKSLSKNIDEMVRSCERIKVHQQSDTVDCGVFALQAIEQDVNPDYPWTSPIEPLESRIRYLRLLSSFTKVPEDSAVKFYWSARPDKLVVTNLKEDMHNYLLSLASSINKVDDVDMETRSDSDASKYTEESDTEYFFDDDKDQSLGKWKSEDTGRSRAIEDINDFNTLEDGHGTGQDDVSRVDQDDTSKVDQDDTSKVDQDDTSKVDQDDESNTAGSSSSVGEDNVDNDGTRLIDTPLCSRASSAIESQDEGQVNDQWSPSLGYQFADIIEATSMITNYGRRKGFKIRVNRSSSHEKKVQIVCSCHGHHLPKIASQSGRSKRSGCKFTLNLSSPKSIQPRWRVTHIFDHHNHELSVTQPPTERLSESDMLQIKKAVRLDWSISKTITALEFNRDPSSSKTNAMPVFNRREIKLILDRLKSVSSGDESDSCSEETRARKKRYAEMMDTMEGIAKMSSYDQGRFEEVLGEVKAIEKSLKKRKTAGSM